MVFDVNGRVIVCTMCNTTQRVCCVLERMCCPWVLGLCIMKGYTDICITRLVVCVIKVCVSYLARPGHLALAEGMLRSFHYPSVTSSECFVAQSSRAQSHWWWKEEGRGCW